MNIQPLLFVAAILGLIGTVDASAGRIYKWTDEKGVTHYGESIPPEYQNQTATELQGGIAVRKIESAATLEAQRKAAEQRALLDREEAKRTAEQRRRDQALMNTYTSAREIDAARDRNLAGPLQAIRALEQRMKKVQDEVAALEHQAQGVSGNRADVIRQEIEEKKAVLGDMQAEKERHESEMQAIRVRYEADKKRYSELTQR